MYSVTVLTPTGRRHQVKVSPNTTLIQVLEEVCKKFGLNAKQYDLRHHNKILDVSSMFRFTSLPNNAQLEMTEAVRERQESSVTLGLQLETGERLTGNFNPSDSIWNVIVTLIPEEKIPVNLVVIYMRQEIYGRENLYSTTLRSLGLTGGRAMLRLLDKSPEELKVQANVSKNIERVPSVPEKPLQVEKSANVKKEKNVEGKEFLIREPSVDTNTALPKPFNGEEKVTNNVKVDNTDMKKNVLQKLLKNEKSMRASTKENWNQSGEPMKITEPKERKTQETNSQKKVIERKTEENHIILLGKRNAVAYNLNNVKPVVFEEEPEDFFDLTISDAKILLKQAKQLCADLENSPLMTSAQRELEKDKKVLSLLHQYRRTVLRVTFPDRIVLQGTFSPVETVADVEKFVSEYLENSNLKFYLYTSPPKVVLKSEERLIECGCVPSSIVYFGLVSNILEPKQYLKQEVLLKLSTPSAAALAALESRVDRKLPKENVEEAEKRKWSRSPKNSEPGPSSSKQWGETSSSHSKSPVVKVPKWFKTNK